MKVAIIGGGNGGQAIAGHIAAMGHIVRLYDRNMDRVRELNKTKCIQLSGALQLKGQIEFASIDIAKVVKDADLIMVATTATAHRSVATRLAPLLTENQVVVLNPGRTCGAIEFKKVLDDFAISKKVYIAEAQTLIYACRLIQEGKVNVIGVKDKVLLASYPASDTQYVLNVLGKLFDCFYPAKNVLQKSFENIGAIFHPSVVLFNEATIERGSNFYFYRDMTDGLARMIEAVDVERIQVAQAYGISPISAFDWVSYAYNGVDGNTLCERMHNNPAYYEILAPTTIECRQITEDIPTGIIPFAELGDAADVDTPAMDALITMCSILLKKDFRKEGRTLKNLGFANCSVKEIIKKIH
ncbi:MAG: NAD/NADP octopine/nopaline dehydrogenase family protein [Muribaculum sp.]|nr:NAD/NADP octopine/nopaline dehydrogenase family protein [Muribaculum sp.]